MLKASPCFQPSAEARRCPVVTQLPRRESEPEPLNRPSQATCDRTAAQLPVYGPALLLVFLRRSLPKVPAKRPGSLGLPAWRGSGALSGLKGQRREQPPELFRFTVKHEELDRFHSLKR